MTQHISKYEYYNVFLTDLSMVDITSENQLVSAPVEMVVHDEGLIFSVGSLSKDRELTYKVLQERDMIFRENPPGDLMFFISQGHVSREMDQRWRSSVMETTLEVEVGW
ncbi:unnamed protein product [Merluccius merluccius]